MVAEAVSEDPGLSFTAVTAVATGLEVRDVLRWVSGGRSTASLRLRPLSLDDLAPVIEVEADPATNRHSPTGPPTSPEVERRLRVSVEA